MNVQIKMDAPKLHAMAASFPTAKLQTRAV